MNIDNIDIDNITEDDINLIYAFLDDNFSDFNELEKHIWIEFITSIDKEFKADIADSNWMDYITKELGNKDTDNVFWDLMV